MTYQEATEYLFCKTSNFEQQGVGGYKEGLENTLKLDEHFGHPHEHYRCIHIAGTNGKGSVSNMLAAQLQACGYKVGLYTSPHIVDFKERIRVNGTPISEDYVTNFVDTEKAFFESFNPTFFEIATAMAFKYFKEMDVDIAVVEVGLGGRLDCTNIITPILSVITNISLDHTQLLGNSLEQIAIEKGGIIKRGIPVVIGESTPETKAVFDMLATEVHAPITYAEEQDEVISWEEEPNGAGIKYHTKHYGDFVCELSGSFQPKNMKTVLEAMHQLEKQGYMSAYPESGHNENTIAEIENAFKNVTNITGLMARWQIVRQHPTVVCDTGHNPGAWEYLGKQLENTKCRELRIVFGLVEDKDVYTVMSLLPKNATYYYTKGSTKRAFPETSLKIFGDQFGLKGDCYPTVEDAYQAAMQGATSEDFIFVGGSTYVVADFMKSRI